jgi:hypothetical protein
MFVPRPWLQPRPAFAASTRRTEVDPASAQHPATAPPPPPPSMAPPRPAGSAGCPPPPAAPPPPPRRPPTPFTPSMCSASVTTSPPKPSSPRAAPSGSAPTASPAAAPASGSSAGTARCAVMTPSTPAVDRRPERRQLHVVQTRRSTCRTGSARCESVSVSPCPGKCFTTVSRPALRAPDERHHPLRHPRRVAPVRPRVDHRVQPGSRSRPPPARTPCGSPPPAPPARDPARLVRQLRLARRRHRHVDGQHRRAPQPRPGPHSRSAVTSSGTRDHPCSSFSQLAVSRDPPTPTMNPPTRSPSPDAALAATALPAAGRPPSM